MLGQGRCFLSSVFSQRILENELRFLFIQFYFLATNFDLNYIIAMVNSVLYSHMIDLLFLKIQAVCVESFQFYSRHVLWFFLREHNLNYGPFRVDCTLECCCVILLLTFLPSTFLSITSAKHRIGMEDSLSSQTGSLSCSVSQMSSV